MVHGAAGETSIWEEGPARTQGRWKHESEALKVGQGRSQAPQGKVRERGRGSGGPHGNLVCTLNRVESHESFKQKNRKVMRFGLIFKSHPSSCSERNGLGNIDIETGSFPSAKWPSCLRVPH